MILTGASYDDAFEEKTKKERSVEQLTKSRKLCLLKLIQYRAQINELLKRNQYLEGLVNDIINDTEEDLEINMEAHE